MTDSTDFLTQQLHTLRQTVGYLRERGAAVGGEVFLPPSDRHRLCQARTEIAACKAELRTRGAVVDDEPMDTAPPAAQGGLAQQSWSVPQVATTNNHNAGNRGAQGIFHGPVTIYGAIASQSRASGIFQLRAPVPDFVGRDAELERLLAVLRPGQVGRVVTISGVRGISGLGKTELAYAVAAQLRDDYLDGQILVEMTGNSATPLSPALSLQKVIRAFRPEEKLPKELPALQKLYRSVLSGRRVLILADDVRDAIQVCPLLPTPGSALLITSRQRFALDGMTVLDLEHLEESAAITLLRGICPRLTEDQARRIGALCEHLPSALRVSAVILLNNPALSPEHYLARLATQPLANRRDPDNSVDVVGAISDLRYATLVVFTILISTIIYLLIRPNPNTAGSLSSVAGPCDSISINHQGTVEVALSVSTWYVVEEWDNTINPKIHKFLIQTGPGSVSAHPIQGKRAWQCPNQISAQTEATRSANEYKYSHPDNRVYGPNGLEILLPTTSTPIIPVETSITIVQYGVADQGEQHSSLASPVF